MITANTCTCRDEGTVVDVQLDGLTGGHSGAEIDKIRANANKMMGRFLYEGKVMVGVDSNSPFARYGEKKVVTDRDLQYSTAAHPKVEKKWFDAAKRDHGSDWVRMAKKVAGGGK